MTLANKTEIVLKYLFLCSSLVLSVFAAVPFSSDDGSSDLGTGFGPRNTRFSAPKFNESSDISNAPIISIADGKNAIRAGVTTPAPISKIPSKNAFPNTTAKRSSPGNSAAKPAPSKQPPYNTFYQSETDAKKLNESFVDKYSQQPGLSPSFNTEKNISANNPVINRLAQNTTGEQTNVNNFQLGQSKSSENSLMNFAHTNAGVIDTSYRTNSSELQSTSTDISGKNASSTRLNVTADADPTKDNEQVKVLGSPLAGNKGFRRPSMLVLKGYTAPTIQNHNYLKSLQLLKGSSNEQSNKTQSQIFVIGSAVLFIVFIILMCPLLLKCTKGILY